MKAGTPKNHFTVGIVDDVTHTSLEVTPGFRTVPEGTIQCKFWGLGADGTVGANRSAIKIIGDNSDLYAQAYFAYDSKKSGGITVSHLRFGKHPIKSTYLIDSADYVAVHKTNYVEIYDVLDGIKDGGIFVLNSDWTAEDMETKLPANVRRTIAQKKLQFYNIDAVKIAMEIGLGGRINMIMQTAFFSLAKVIPVDEAIRLLKEQIEEMFSAKGDKIVKMNFAAVDQTLDNLKQIDYPASWAEAKDEPVKEKDEPDFVKNVLRPMERKKATNCRSARSRRTASFHWPGPGMKNAGVAINVPEWIKDNCIQCNQCAMVCPHAAIRPFMLDDDELKSAPEGFETIDAWARKQRGIISGCR